MPKVTSINYSSFIKCTSLTTITMPFIDIDYDPDSNNYYYQFGDCSSLSTLHLIWPDSITESDRELDLKSLLPDSEWNPTGTTVYTQIRYIDLSGTLTADKTLRVKYYNDVEEGIVLNAENEWRYPFH
jgi:hypothetical protein